MHRATQGKKGWRRVEKTKTQEANRLEDHAVLLLLLLGGRAEDDADGLIKDVLQSLLGQGRALKVLGSSNLLGEPQSLLVGNGVCSLLVELLQSSGVVPQVNLGADEDHGGAWGVVADLRVPLVLDVLEGGVAHNRVRDKEHISLRVRQRAKTVIIFLT